MDFCTQNVIGQPLLGEFHKMRMVEILLLAKCTNTFPAVAFNLDVLAIRLGLRWQSSSVVKYTLVGWVGEDDADHVDGRW